ncbi:bifunctional diguanylate cyclase/phosphodiesterase [Stenotrophomonas sp. JAI102]|uniref:putative bifunctional diguanylate cyclase/phosphodiesterase n=1 Tax=Stenotrophomonas sp. JAI102 TaxID=2723077 RepID=UPI0015CA1029|nr:bifunctional diguanylate cyclase/phosphodiesterase [Stenotrophomonas sp. JAI102]NYF35217.1 diguanylate cyclase (GGDEF)-like protein [Stenotrophomonas sp. JAI102]
MLIGSYTPWLVVVSFLVAVLASFTALDMASRVTTAATPRTTWLWLVGGGCAMGLGIWSMHFIGMLAFRLPIPLGYALGLTTVSLLAAMASSIFALWLVSQPTLPHGRLALGAVLMGSGIASMHYLGMAALHMQPGIDYHAGWVALSLVIAVVASWTALFIAFRLRSTHRRLRDRAAPALVLGTAIVGMHYTGMAAARFPAGSICGAAAGDGLQAQWLALVVLVLTIAILAVVLIVSWLDQRMEAQLLRLRNTDLSSSLDDAHAELTQAALHDPLTRLPNRRLLQQRIEQSLAEAEQRGSRFAVMFMDLDGFKQVNDAYGHQTGDALLVAVADRTRRLLRPADMMARLGGDEFVLVVPIENDEDVATLASRIIQTVGCEPLLPRHDLQVTASIGIAICPDHAASERQLMGFADAAMYQAKEAGRNAYVLFADWMNDSAEQQFQLLADLRRAIGTEQLFLHYQPKTRVAAQSVSGAEALIRWRHPQQGLIPPDRFIRLAERSGVINEIGRWALDEACRQLRSWHDAGHDGWTVSVNLSPIQFASPNLLQEVREALQTHRIEPRRLILEITENTVMRDTEASLTLLQAMAALGVGISIDDFGTGYSSLLYLKRLPATEIKIDHAFVSDLENSSEDVVIVSAIVALGHALDMDIVAEGVETVGQRVYLERLGCDYLQGYLLGRPVDAQRFMQLHDLPRPRVEVAAGWTPQARPGASAG